MWKTERTNRALARPIAVTAAAKMLLLLAAMLFTGTLHGGPGPGPGPAPWSVPPPPTPYKPFTPPTEPIVGTNHPSAYLPGSGSVKPTGEYHYDIPIQVPPGLAGMQPDLALSYSSRAGDGPLGVGWSLSGLSEIHRCPSIWAIDQKSDGIAYEPTDKLCIDGNRLLLVRQDGNKDYYVTEQETFARIESVLDESTRSRTFTVYAKDARILQYEPMVMEDHPSAGVNTDLVWPLRHVKDRAGNIIDYKYDYTVDAPKYSYEIMSIKYPAGRVVEFDYMDRTAPKIAWTSGIARVVDRQLKQIRLATPDHPDFATYALDWTVSAATLRPLLNGVQRCALGTCTQAKQFEYDQPELSFSQMDYPGIAQPFISGGEVWADIAVADIDGNGFDDLVYPYGLGDQNASQAAMAVSSEMFQPSATSSFYPALTEAFQVMNTAATVCVPVDSDADGRVEVVLFPATGDSFTKGFRPFRWDASAGALVEDPAFPNVPQTYPPPASLTLELIGYQNIYIAAQTPYFADVDGDGLPDLLRSEFTVDANDHILNPELMFSRNVLGSFAPLQPQGVTVITQFPSALAKHGGRAIDRFGDHRAGLHVTDNQTNGSSAITVFQDDIGQFLTHDDARCENIAGRQYDLKLDVNGDGLEDRLCVRVVDAGSDDPEVCINSGAHDNWDQCGVAFFAPDLPANFDDGASRFLTGDLNGDGIEDVVAWRQAQAGSIVVYRGFPTVGWGWANVATLDNLTDGLQVARLGDFNGDGRLDIAAIHGAADIMQGPTLRVYFQNESYTDLLRKVKEEGNERATEDVLYRKWEPESGSAGDCNYPQRCVKRGELTVVKSRRVLNPSAPDPDVTLDDIVAYYTYEDPRVDLEGRGFLGFRTVRAWNPQRPIQVTTTYENDWVDATLPGRVAYPRAAVPMRTTTVIPILDVPAEGRAPVAGLPEHVKARVIQTDNTYLTEWTSAGSYWVHPETATTKEWEEDACIDWDTQGHFVRGAIGCIDGAADNPLRTRHATYDYDQYGTLWKEHVHTDGGVSNEIETQYENRVSDWLLSLPLKQTERSANGVNQPWATRVTEFTHDALGLLQFVYVEPSSPDPDVRLTVEYKRNPAGQVIGVRRMAPGTAERHTYVHYDSSGVFPDVVWNDLGHARWTAYDDALAAPTVTLENVQLTQWVHDGFGRVRHIVPETGATLTSIYELRGSPGFFHGTDITAIGDAGDYETTSTDEWGRTVEHERAGFGNGQWIHRSLTYDVLGRVREASRPGFGAPSAASTVYERDSLDRLTSETGPDGKSATYQPTFLETTSTDADKRKRKVTRDVDGRVSSTVSYEAIGSQIEARETKFTYSEFDLLWRVEDPAHNLTTMTYDVRGRRRTQVDWDAGIALTYYNGFGEQRHVDTATSSADIQYDRAGRVTQIDDTVDGLTELVWDVSQSEPGPNPMGQLVDAVSPDGTKIHRKYDPYGRLTDSVWGVGQESFAISLAYDTQGRPGTIEFPWVAGIGRASLEYTYNDNNYLAEVNNTTGSGSTPIWRVSERSADDALAKAGYGSDLSDPAAAAVKLVRTYEAQTGRLHNVHASRTSGAQPANGLFDVTYDYHDNGQVASRDDAVAGQKEIFDYDDLDRLRLWTLQTEGSGAQVSTQTKYGYDPIGNLTDVHVDGTLTVANHYDGPRPHAVEWSDVVGVGIDDQVYDAKGRQTVGGGRDFVTYSSFDLPVAVDNAEGKTSFAYDAYHSRVRRIAPSGEVIVSLGGLYERRGTGPGNYEHVFRVPGGEGPVAELVYDEAQPAAGIAARFIVADMLGSASLVTSETGTVLDRLFYDPHGKRVGTLGGPAPAVTTTRHGYTDHWHDDDLGLIDMHGRVYDPTIRRFLTPDPLVANPLLGEAYNRYSYGFNDPVNHTDPTGFETDPPGTTPSGNDRTTGGCMGGNCGGAGGDGGRTPVLARSDFQGWRSSGCPRSAGGWAHGPCPKGPVSAGCGGKQKTSVDIAVDVTIGAGEGVGKIAVGLALNALTLGGYSTLGFWSSVADGYEKEGVVGALNAANPFYHLGKAGADTYLAAERGDYRAVGEGSVGVVVAGLGVVGTVAAIVEVAGVAGSSSAAAAGDGPLLFGQKRVGPNFRINSNASDAIRGQSLTDVADGLRSGKISPNELPIDFFVRNGQRITVNNRGLATLRMAGKEPTILREVPANSNLLGRLGESPIDAAHRFPGTRMAVTANRDGTGHVYTVVGF